MADSQTLYHFADGVILAIGPEAARLHHLPRDYDIEIDLRFLEALEQTCLGATLESFAEYVPKLLAEKILATGPAQNDSYIYERLQRLDQMFAAPTFRDLPGRAREAYEKSLQAHARRKRFFTRVGQCPVLPETTLRRALSAGDAADVGVKKILCVGDDDLTSIALAALGHDVRVFDVDDYLLKFLQQMCKVLDLSITIEERDLRDPLPEKDLESFDLFVTDPMSNRDCFELFLSRALAYLKPNGRGLVACYPPAERLLRQIAGEMEFDPIAWHKRHNHYYSQYMKLHVYESDWVEIQKTPRTRLKYAPSDFAVPMNLYREDFFHRRRALTACYDDIENDHYTKPLFLDMLLDILQAELGITFSTRTMTGGQHWTLAHVVSNEGHLNIYADRPKKQLTVELYPFAPHIEDRLRHLLMSAYKTSAKSATVSTDKSHWDLRVR